MANSWQRGPEPPAIFALATELGHRPEIGDDGIVFWSECLEAGETSISMTVAVAPEADGLEVGVGCPALFVDETRLDGIELVAPLVDLWAEDLSVNPEDPADDWVWVSGVCGLPIAAGLSEIAGAARTVFSAAIGAGIMAVIDGSQHPEVQARWDLLIGLKDEYPAEGLALAQEMAERCGQLGDPISAAKFRVVAGRIAAALGHVTLARDLAEPAWNFMPEVLRDPPAVFDYVEVLRSQGRSDEAEAILLEAEAQALDAEETAMLRVFRGELYVFSDRYSEAIPLLEEATQSAFLPLEYVEAAGLSLSRLRGLIGVSQRPEMRMERFDFLAETGEELLVVAELFQTLDGRVDPAKLADIEFRLNVVRSRWDRLGPLHRANLLIFEALLANYGNEVDTFQRKIRMAGSIAAQAGDEEMLKHIGLVENMFARGMSDSDVPGVPAEDLGLIGQISYHFGRAREGMIASANLDQGEQQEALGRLLPHALEVVRLYEQGGKKFRSPEDRRAWAEKGLQAPEMAFFYAYTLERLDLLIELHERRRAQGMPAESGAAGGSGPFEAIPAVLDELIVGSPRIATISGTSEVTPDSPTLRLHDLVGLATGGEAWWWSCHVIVDRVHWALRSPDGRLAGGFKVAPAGGSFRVEEIHSLFATPMVAGNWEGHLLAGDSADRLELVLEELAELILPPELRMAAEKGAAQGRPIRVLLAPSPRLGNIPLGLLPISKRYRLLHGAVLSIAPPTSLFVDLPDDSKPDYGAEMTILGPELGVDQAMILAGTRGLGVPLDDTFGSPAYLCGEPPLAGQLATPAEVLSSWADPPRDRLLYYGHVDESDDSPLDVSLRLCGGPANVRLRVRDLLVSKRRRAPSVVVMCGCSSMGPATVGSNEWWGFAVGFLWQGSRQVLGSIWNLIDCPATARFAIELMEGLRSGSDPAVVLHGLQLKWLEQWENMAPTPMTGADLDRHPILWAGWVVTGTGWR